MPTQQFVDKLINNLGKVDSPQLRRVLNTLVQQKNFFEIILENMADGVVVTDINLQVLYINKNARNSLIGSTRRAYAGKPLLELVKSPFFEFFTKNNFNKKSPVKDEIIITDPAYAIYSITAHPAFSEDTNEILSLIFILRDITDARHEEDQQKQIEKLSSLSTLTAGVAHDIKNPLNSLDIHAQLMQAMTQNAKSDPDVLNIERLEKSAEVIRQESQRLAGIVDQFLSAVRPTKPNMEFLSLNDIVKQVVGTVEPELDLGLIELKTVLDPELPKIPLDPIQMKRAVYNVLQNAIDAITSKGGKIIIKTYYKSNGVYIDIEDDGCGIPTDKLASIFEPYFTTKESGSGLGLMNVYRIVDEHKGEISVDSEVDQGSVFTIRLPLFHKPIRLLSENSE